MPVVEYKCARCGGEFKSNRPEEEVQAEKRQLFGDVPDEECVLVCDDCFKAFMSPGAGEGVH